MNKQSILPPSSTDVQYALEHAARLLMKSIDNPIREIWNPQTCPLHILPYLAAHLSVDDWSEGWAEDVKRNVISASMIVHAHKGTKGALLALLESLGVQAEIIEWWETSPKGERGTMSITAWASQNLSGSDTLLDDSLISRLKTNIDLTKRMVIHYDLRVGILTKNKIGIAAVGNVSTVARADLTAVAPQGHSSASIALAMLVNPLVIIRGDAA